MVLNNNIQSGYFGKTKTNSVDNELIELGLLDRLPSKVDGISSSIAKANEPSFLEKTADFASDLVSFGATPFKEDGEAERQEFKESSKTAEVIGGIAEKTGESASGGIERIQEAGEGIATGEFDIDEGLARGSAGAIQTFFSPLSGVLGEGLNQTTQALSDDFKESVIEGTTPTIEGAVDWYNSQSPEQQKELDNIGIGVELLIEFVGGRAAVESSKELITNAKRASEEAFKSSKELIGEGIDAAKDKVGDINIPDLPRFGENPSAIAENIAGIDTQTKNVLKEVKKEDFDTYVKIGKDAADNIKNPTPMDIAGQEAADVLKIITDSKKSVGKDMGDVVKNNTNIKVNTKDLSDKYVTFLKDRFNVEVDPKTLRIKEIAGQEASTSDLKLLEMLNDDILSIITVDNIGVKNLDAISSRIKSNFSKILNERGAGSKLTPDEKSLKGFIGKEITGMMKNNLPDQYSEFSSKFAKLLDIEDRLSKLLGDSGDKGASLIKSIYSPQTGARARRLFTELQEETGIDLITKAGLAKFAMQLSGDSRQANLLEALDLGTGFTGKLTSKLKSIPLIGDLAELAEIGAKKVFPTEKVGRGLTK